ncbi:hypothetical protein ABFS83_14G022800 [Erythranthe nasuta]
MKRLMTNTNTEDLDLVLALDSRNYRIQTRLNDISGAGVNANARGDMAFAASDPLAELVWSPHNGLRLKSANSNVADKRPFLMWNVGPSGNALLPSQYIISKEIKDDKTVEANEIFSDKAVRNCNWTEGDSIMEEEVGTRDDLRKEENLCRLENIEIAEMSQKSAAGLDTSANGISDCKVDMTTNSLSPKEPDYELTSATVEVNKNKTDMPNSLGEMKVLKENSRSVEGSPTGSRVFLHQDKGKEKVLSDGDRNVGPSSDDEENTHESVESCNSAVLYCPKGVKRQSCDDLVLESKRMKKEDSSFILRHDSSFMNWISNMVKGISDSNKEYSPLEDSPSAHLALTLACSNDVYGKKTHDSKNLSMGFQTIFQSLSCRNTTVIYKDKEESRVMVAEKSSPESPSLSGEKDKNNSSGLCNKEANPITVGQTSKPWIFSEYVENEDLAKKGVMESDSSGEKTNITAEIKATPDKSNPLTSLWITRLSTKNPRLEMSDEVTRKVNVARAVDDVLPIDRKKPVLGNSFPSYRAWNVKKYYSSKSVSTLNEIGRNSTPNLANNVEDNRNSQNNTAASSKVFHAIRNLRLTRADILRWMNSGVSLSHLSGFFLRLRLGNVEAGQEGGSYYVACITGDGREHKGNRSKKSVLVDVGGIISSVESQYVSNQEFLEDEIEAWWCRIMDSGCKIPSVDELNSKLKDRHILGF